MYVELWEREMQVVLGQFVVDCLVDVEINIPVVFALAPATNDEVYSAIAKTANGHCRNALGILNTQRLSVENCKKDLACLSNIVAIRDTYIPLYATILLG